MILDAKKLHSVNAFLLWEQEPDLFVFHEMYSIRLLTNKMLLKVKNIESTSPREAYDEKINIIMIIILNRNIDFKASLYPKESIRLYYFGITVFFPFCLLLFFLLYQSFKCLIDE